MWNSNLARCGTQNEQDMEHKMSETWNKMSETWNTKGVTCEKQNERDVEHKKSDMWNSKRAGLETQEKLKLKHKTSWT